MTIMLLHLVATSALALGAARPDGRAALRPLCRAAVVAIEQRPDSSHPAPTVPLSRQRPPDGTTRYAILMRAASDTGFHPAATMVVQQATRRVNGNLVIRRVATYTYPDHSHVVDTTMSLAGTLAPILERTHKPSNRVVTYDFAGRLVTGWMGPVASP